MSFLRVLLLSLLCVISLVAMPARAESGAVQALATPHEWLNTDRALSADDLKGRVILLDFWTFCCINCMHVIPDLHYLEEKYGDKLTVIGVHSAKFANERDSENIRQAMLRYDIEHPVINDADFAVWKSFDVHAWPSFVLIGADGKVAKQFSGEGQRRALDAAIADLLEDAGSELNVAALPIALEKDKEPRHILNFPGKLEIAADVNGAPMLFVADSGNDRVVGMNLEGQIVQQIGSGKQGLQDGGFDVAAFHAPQGLLWDAETQTLFVADTENHALRAVDMANKTVTTLAGDGAQGNSRVLQNADAKKTRLASPWDLAFYPDKQHIALAMAGTHQLWTYDREGKTLTVLAGNGRESIDDGSYPFNSLSQPSGLAVMDGALWFVDAETSSLRRLTGKTVETLIGTGLFDFGYKEGKQGEALMQHPLGLTGSGEGILITDSYNHAIRRYDVASATLHNFAGTGERGVADGTLAQAQFNEPNDIAVWQGKYYVADTNNHRIRVIDSAMGTVSSLLVMPMAMPIAFDEALPEADKLASITLRPTGVTLGVSLERGWKINAEAPSYLALYRADAVHSHVASFDRESLKKGVVLPDLEAGGRYVLQGTLYYCEDKAGSVCLIKSIEQEVIAADDGERSLLVSVK